VQGIDVAFALVPFEQIRTKQNNSVLQFTLIAHPAPGIATMPMPLSPYMLKGEPTTTPAWTTL